MRRMIALVTVAALLWSGVWGWQAMQMRAGLATWFEERRADGWEAEYTALRVRGFPSRIDVTIDAPRLFDPETGVGWRAPFFQILGLTYRPGHVILAFPDRQTLTLPEGPQEISAQGMRASLVHDRGALLRMNMEAETFNLARADGDLALAGVGFALHRAETAPEDMRLGLSIDALATPNATLSDGVGVEALIGFDRPWRLEALGGPRPQPRRIDLRHATYSLETLSLSLAGVLDVDGRGEARGEITLRAENWQEALANARANGAVPAGLADTLSQALTLASGLNGRRDTLDLPLRFSGGTVSMGILPLGPAPRFSLP